MKKNKTWYLQSRQNFSDRATMQDAWEKGEKFSRLATGELISLGKRVELLRQDVRYIVLVSPNLDEVEIDLCKS